MVNISITKNGGFSVTDEHGNDVPPVDASCFEHLRTDATVEAHWLIYGGSGNGEPPTVEYLDDLIARVHQIRTCSREYVTGYLDHLIARLHQMREEVAKHSETKESNEQTD